MSRTIADMRADDKAKALAWFSGPASDTAKAHRDVRQLLGLLDEAADILQELMDHQNGCPLPKYEAAWTRAMENGESLIAKLREGTRA